ncbi:aryl hydrocarbon receptor-like isoform X2 [Narcine bancroftii]|uniref:aryl hydrocarbon receptor-like isoform X2 n=1 Tax=Narcine bancroftii TaxID=1343680 RepID=UPI0038321BBD
MLGGGGVYAVKKRKKPMQKSPRPPAADGVKWNPSKRHRDRLNSELDKLTGLLPFPEDVRARLDKLSVLRLSVGYLKAKSFFSASMKKNRSSWMPDKVTTQQANGQLNAQKDIPVFSEGELLLEALNGFILVVTAEGYVFYTSSTIQDYLGFHQSDVVHQSVFELIHTDDRSLFRRQLHWALNPPAFQESNSHTAAILESSSLCPSVVTYDPHHLPPENSSFMERNFICRFRCLLDNSSGFLTLNFQGRLKFLHGQNKKAEDGTPIPPQLALFALATPLQPPSILEIRTKTHIFQTKHKLDFTPLACDTKGKFILGYTDTELCMRGTGYQFIHAADMMYCADNHLKMMKTGETGMTVFRLLTKSSSWVWVQSNARLVYRGGQPDSIICKQRALTNEEGEEHLRKRSMALPFSFATGEAVLYESSLLHLDPSLAKGKSVKIKQLSAGVNSVEQNNGINPGSLLGALMTQNISAYISHHESPFTLDSAYTDDYAVLNVPGDFSQLVSGGKNSSKSQEVVRGQDDALVAIMDLLSEQNLDENDLCDTLQNLEVEQAELEQWKETLMKMNSSPRFSDDMNEVFTTDFILSCVEDMLLKDNAKGNEFLQVGLNCTEGNLIRPAQQSLCGSMEQKPFGFDNQIPTRVNCCNLMMDNPVIRTPQNTLTPLCQTSVMSDPQNPSMPVRQTPVLPCPQKVPVSQPHLTTSFGSPNACVTQQQIKTQNPFPTVSRTDLGNSLAPDSLGSVSYGAQQPCRGGAQRMSCGRQTHLLHEHAGNRSPTQMPQRDWQPGPNCVGANVVQDVYSVNTAQQHAPQWPAMQSGQLASVQPYAARDARRLPLPQSSCRFVQGPEDKVTTAAYPDQSHADQLHYSYNEAIDQSTSVNQLPAGVPLNCSSSCMFASCQYQSHTSIGRNGLTFPGNSSTAPVPPYGKVKASPNRSPLRPTCCCENEATSPTMGSAMPNGEVTAYQSSCQFEPTFAHLPEGSICEIPPGPVTWNYSHFKGQALN